MTADLAGRKASGLPPQILPLRHTGRTDLERFGNRTNRLAGVSPRRAFDDEYQGFFALVAGQVTTAIANARAYEEERRRAEALAEIDRAKTAFFSNVSHEFRTPLTLMLGPLEDALAEDGLSPEAHEQLKVAYRNSLRLLKLVNTLLDFSRIEAGRIHAVYEPVDLAALTADLEDATRIMTRVQTPSQQNFATEADLTKAQARVGVLNAQLRQAQSQFETAKIDARRSASMLDKHQIRAPFSGVVIDRSAQPGEMISPMSVGGYTRTGICTIVDMDSIEIEVDVNEAFIGRVVPGGAVNAMLDAYPDWTIPASVIAIVPTANREKATVKVRIRFEKKDPRILPDMAVKVNFLTDAKENSRAKGAEATAAN